MTFTTLLLLILSPLVIADGWRKHSQLDMLIGSICLAVALMHTGWVS